MTDLEMTKLCAEAMGYRPSTFSLDGRFFIDQVTVQTRYDPLQDDAQAMALVKKLGLTVDPQEDKPPFTWRVVVADNGDWDKKIIFADGLDLNRAIVACAAAVQAAKVAA